MGNMLTRILNDSEATVALGAEIAHACQQATTIFYMVIWGQERPPYPEDLSQLWVIMAKLRAQLIH